ncbi:POLO box domain-containing protein OS=Streptomyces microflavus OX=1919 GN=Smic_63960 PE=4 SV=1 [Streptomyces microflavus]
MADRYDESSVENVDKYETRDAASTDNWADLVTHITGYPVPKRSEIFDTLRSDHGGKLFRMDIKERSLGLLVKDSGFLRDKGQDYDIWFFDSGKKRSIMQARIVFEGRVKSGDEIIFAGTDSTDVNNVSVREGNEFTDYNKDKFSTIPLARYMNGPRAALMALLKGNSGDGRFSGLVAKESDVVDLESFTRAGHSFDYAAQFFKYHAPVLKDWEDRFSRDDASWKGEAAEVFRSLIKKIRENYDNYVETFNETAGSGDATGTGSTVYSRALSLGRSHLEQAARDLLNNWLTWAQSDYYDPHRVLRYVLDDLAQWVDTENVARTDIKSYTTRYSTTVSHSPQAGFSQVHPEYGDLTDIANWAKVGDKAVDIWSRAVDDMLVEPAREVQSRLNNQFLTLSKDFSENVPEPKSTSTAGEAAPEEEACPVTEKLHDPNEENPRPGRPRSPTAPRTTRRMPGGGSGGGPRRPRSSGHAQLPRHAEGGGRTGGMGARRREGHQDELRAEQCLVDAAEESERRNRRRRSPWNRQEDSDTFLTPASRVATTGGGDSPAEEQEQGRRPVTSADYLEEDADVWGTEEGGTPAVIGR